MRTMQELVEEAEGKSPPAIKRWFDSLPAEERGVIERRMVYLSEVNRYDGVADSAKPTLDDYDSLMP